jgi:hypothetical protein
MTPSSTARPFIELGRDQVREHAPHQFVACASDLGWPPGMWPASVGTDIGNGHPFVLHSTQESHATYVQNFGCVTLDVLND